MTEKEQQAIGAHFIQLKDLYENKKIRLIGRREDGQFGLAILDVPSLREAEAIMKADAAVRAGVFSATVGEFKLVMGGFA